MPINKSQPLVVIFTDLFPKYKGDITGNFVYDRWENFAKSNSEFLVQLLVLTDYKYKNYPQLPHTFYLKRIWTLPRKNKFVIPSVLLYSLSNIIGIFLKNHFHKSPKVVIVEYGSPKSILCAIFSKMLKFRFGIVLRGSDVHVGIQGNTIIKRMLRWSYKTADFLLPVSQEMKNALIMKGCDKRKIRVVHGSFAPIWRNFVPNTVKSRPKENNILAMVSSFANGKRQDLLIESFKEIKREITNAELWLIGDGTNFIRCQKIAQNMQGIKFFGAIRNKKKLITLLQRITLFIHLSDHEGLPTVIMEAMALGLPIVASNVGGIPELLKNNTGVIVPNEKKTIVDVCIKFLKNEALRNEYSENAKQNSVFYSSEMEAALLRNVILKILSIDDLSR